MILYTNFCKFRSCKYSVNIFIELKHSYFIQFYNLKKKCVYYSYLRCSSKFRMKILLSIFSKSRLEYFN